MAQKIESPLQALDAIGFAQEFLRRNPLYRAEHAQLPSAGRDQGEGEVMARRWGLVFPVRP